VFEATGRVALVTGAGQGVGVGIARALVAQGARVAVNDLVADRAETTAMEIGDGAIAVPFDVTDRAAVDAGVARITEELGPVDILVNNAGVPVGMDLVQFGQADPEQWKLYVNLNMYGSMHCIQAVLGGMCDRGWGRVVQISSGAGRAGLNLGISMYGASKSGIEGLIRHLSQEVARKGVTANSLALGMMGHAGADVDDEATRPLIRTIPVGRLGTPDDVGAAVVYLASDEASWLTGQTIDLNGGSVQH
jgi:NAD(P)-dependent dehydrogenase (short-subunit alcohol dehydrogenase family)